MLKNNRSVVLSTDELALNFNSYKLQDRPILNREVETFTTKVMKNARLKKFTITLLGLSLYFKDVFAVAATKGPDKLGWLLLGLIREWAYWVLLLWCIVEVIRNGISGDGKKTLPTIMKFVIIFASMYFIPSLFNAIKEGGF